MQRTILSQWFPFLVPDLKILRLYIVSVVCVSGALVDLDFLFLFFLIFPISISHLSLFATFPFFFFFFPISFHFLFVDQSLSLIRCCFCRVTHANSLFPFAIHS